MKINNKVGFAVCLVFLTLLGYLFFKQYTASKIAVVDTKRVLENYKGFKEAQDLYEIKINEMSKTFEEQKSIFESKSNEVKILSEKLSKVDLAQKQAELEVFKAQVYQLGKAIEEKAAKHEEKLLQGVYNKINDFITRYGEKNGIGLITGITLSGNVLYVSDALDITDEIIKEINNEYIEGVK